MMTSQYLIDKYNVLKAIEQGCIDFCDIAWFAELEPIRVRGLLRYFMTRNDIKKYEKNPSRYELTEKGYGKLNHWAKKKKEDEWKT